MKENTVYVIQEVAGTQSGAPKILILGRPSLVPGTSCITYTVGNFFSFMLDNIMFDGYIVN